MGPGWGALGGRQDAGRTADIRHPKLVKLARLLPGNPPARHPMIHLTESA
jgi:hypothetical protein